LPGGSRGLGDVYKRQAYTYLPESVEAFPDGPAFISIYEECGFVNTKWISMTGGICSIYLGHKKAKNA
jgi:demethylmenaquinone methyltransferase/2-methoxy-6-polyprenyl-1,4-benzoquinol methylase